MALTVANAAITDGIAGTGHRTTRFGATLSDVGDGFGGHGDGAIGIFGARGP